MCRNKIRVVFHSRLYESAPQVVFPIADLQRPTSRKDGSD